MSGLREAAEGVGVFALGPNGSRLLNEVAEDDLVPPEHRRLEVTLLWGDTVIDVRSFPPGERVRVGPTPDADLRIYESTVAGGFDLVAEGSIHVPATATAAVYRGDQAGATAEPFELALNERALVSLRRTHLILRWTQPSARTGTGLCDSLDLYFTRALSAALVLHLALLAAFLVTPLGGETLTEEVFKGGGPLVKVWPKSPRPEGSRIACEGLGGSLASREQRRQTSHAHKPAGAGDSRERNRQRVLNAGILSGTRGSSSLNALFGSDGLSARLGEALGHLYGSPGAGDVAGVGSGGSRGTGPGNGGQAIGIGDLPGGRAGGHIGDLQLGGRPKAATEIRPAKANVTGDALPREVIERIIRQHQNEIRYCYDVELDRNHDLYGKVAVAFTIDGTGAVSEASVSETTMNNTNVESCLATKIRRWRFPEPRGGGQVFVTYPWIFKAPGSEE